MKEVESDVDTRHYVKNRIKYSRSKKRFNTKRESYNVENSTAENDKDKINKPRFPRKQMYKKVEAVEENNPSAEVQVSTCVYISQNCCRFLSINDKFFLKK